MVTRLDRAYDAQILDVRTKVLAFVKRSWNGSPAYRDADSERLIAAIVPRIEAGQKRIAELTDAYIARVAASELGAPVKRGSVADATTEALRGVDAETVYRRPFTTVYTELSTGSSVSAAISAGGHRLLSIVETGMQLSATHSARQAGGRSGVKLWRRRLTGRENCALCVVASTQRYFRGDLMPIHGGCDCHPEPFMGDPGEHIIDQKTLEKLHSAVESQFGTTDRGARYIDGRGAYNDYEDLIVTNLHSEIGPTLGWRHQHFTSISEIEDRL